MAELVDRDRPERFAPGKGCAMHDDDLPDVPTCETDDRFPSGTWVGYFIQWNSRSRTELDLFFKDGLISGAGAAWVGEFIVKGRYQIDDGNHISHLSRANGRYDLS